MVESDSDFIAPTVPVKAPILRVDLSLNGLKQTATVQSIDIKGQKIFNGLPANDQPRFTLGDK
jgi:hypothetical protein